MQRAPRAGFLCLVFQCVNAVVVAALVLRGHEVHPLLLGALASALLCTVAAGVLDPASGVFARPILGVRPELAGQRFCLTFDDGPSPEHTQKVMELLEARGHKGTFFVIGARAEQHPELIAEIARRGHGLGNHSYHHAWRTPLMSPKTLADELGRAGSVIARSSGSRPAWFRPPVGLISPPVAAAAHRAGLELVAWSETARDGVASATVEKASRRLLRALRPGAILVLHDAAERGTRSPIVCEVLAAVLDAAQSKGLRSVTLDELLRPQPPTERDAAATENSAAATSETV